MWEAVRKMVRFKIHLKKSLWDLEIGLMYVVSKTEVNYDNNLVLYIKMLLSSYIEILALRTLGIVVCRLRVNAGIVS